jgi:hypothetical protein
MPPYLANAETNKFVLKNSTIINFISLGPVVVYIENTDFITDF